MPKKSNMIKSKRSEKYLIETTWQIYIGQNLFDISVRDGKNPEAKDINRTNYSPDEHKMSCEV